LPAYYPGLSTFLTSEVSCRLAGDILRPATRDLAVDPLSASPANLALDMIPGSAIMKVAAAALMPHSKR